MVPRAGKSIGFDPIPNEPLDAERGGGWYALPVIGLGWQGGSGRPSAGWTEPKPIGTEAPASRLASDAERRVGLPPSVDVEDICAEKPADNKGCSACTLRKNHGSAEGGGGCGE